MKMLVELMGGDVLPEVVMLGVEKARDHELYLESRFYGDEAKIKPLIYNVDRLTIIYTLEKMYSDDEPGCAIARKKQASMGLAAVAV